MAPWRMSVPIAVAGLKLKRKMRIGVIRAPPPMPVIPTSNPVTRPARTSRGSFTRGSVDDEDVARRATQHVLRHAALDEPLDEALLAHPDDDQVGFALARERDDGIGRLPDGADDLGVDTPALEEGPGLLETLPRIALGLRRLVVIRGDNVRHDQR